MSAHSVSFASPRLRGASPDAVAGLAADLAFCHPAIVGVAAIDVEGGAVTVHVDRLLAAGDGADLARQMAAVIDLSLASYRFVEARPPLWSRRALARYEGGAAALAEFVARFTRPLGPGQHALLGPAALLREALDRRLRRLAATVDAEPWHLPSIEASDDLIPRTGYFSSHPQLVTWGYRLATRYDGIHEFARAAREQRLAAPRPADPVEATGFILEPFVCHNVYRALRAEHVGAGRTVTALGNCYRHEGFRFEPLLRQWEFSMREIVPVGPRAHVAEVRRALLAGAQALAEELDLDADLEIATDPFFVSEAASKRTFQAMESTKLELRLGIDARRASAAASFNLHGTHFTEPMGIRADGAEPAETACVAFGIERWMAAVVARWGGAPAAWPECLRTTAPSVPG